jgi:hypothetical protein
VALAMHGREREAVKPTGECESEALVRNADRWSVKSRAARNGALAGGTGKGRSMLAEPGGRGGPEPPPAGTEWRAAVTCQHC